MLSCTWFPVAMGTRLLTFLLGVEVVAVPSTAPVPEAVTSLRATVVVPLDLQFGLCAILTRIRRLLTNYNSSIQNAKLADVVTKKENWILFKLLLFDTFTDTGRYI